MKTKLTNWALHTISANNLQFMSPLDIRECIYAIKALPPLPGTLSKTINLLADPDVDADEVAEMIEQDPILTAQIIKNARSSLYGYRGEIHSVREAIVQVLGLRYVISMIMGLSALQPLQAPKQGRTGMHMFWVHSIASTRLMTKLAKNLDDSSDIKSQDILFCSLIHNIGFPLLGHQFPEISQNLEKLISANTGIPIYRIETFAFGSDHTQLGEWLMRAWSMPTSIVTVVRHHHNPNYRGKDFKLNLLTYVTDYLLGTIGIGDAMNEECKPETWTALSLQPAIAYKALESIEREIHSITMAANELI
jgi:HD-like signal output (HDOD) protein